MPNEDEKNSGENLTAFHIIKMLGHMATIAISIVTFILLVSGFFDFKSQVYANGKQIEINTLKLKELENCKNEMEKKMAIFEEKHKGK